MTTRTKVFTGLIATGFIAAILVGRRKINLRVRVIEASTDGTTGKVEYELTILGKVIKGTVVLAGQPLVFNLQEGNYLFNIISTVGTPTFAIDESFPVNFQLLDTNKQEVVISYSMAAVPELSGKWINV